MQPSQNQVRENITKTNKLQEEALIKQEEKIDLDRAAEMVVWLAVGNLRFQLTFGWQLAILGFSVLCIFLCSV